MMRFLRRKPRVLVVGLDCAPPELVFEQFANNLPHLTRLRTSGTWGTLQSSTPCITVPAWSSMLSGRDPGVLGLYGFRNRTNYQYDGLRVADGSVVRQRRVWDYLSEAGQQSVVVGVPQTFPVKPINGVLVGGFLTPGTASAFTYPAILKQEIMQRFPDYAFDVKGFRTDDKQWLQQRISDVTATQFALFKHLLTTRDWDFAMFVNMGTDRMHHGFWRYHDPAHRLHQSGNPFQSAIRDYYKQVDAHIGDLLNAVDDYTTVLVVSDHGVRRMDGAICINEWLWREGWLALKRAPDLGTVTPFDPANVDWSKTRAWSTGGYYGRIFLNVAGREPEGTIPSSEYESVRDEIRAALQVIPAPDGTPLPTTVYKPDEIYQQTNGIPPDLLVYFGDLHWRCVGGLGYEGIHTLENDTGPDDANHSPDGLFILNEADRKGRGEVEGHQLMDIAPTLLHRLRLTVPSDMQGRVIPG